MQKPTLYKKGYMSPLHVFSFKNCFTCTSGDLIFYSTLTLNIVWNFLLINLTIFERNCRIYAICIFVKKQGSKLFSSNGRVNIFSAESKKIFVKKQPHPPQSVFPHARERVSQSPVVEPPRPGHEPLAAGGGAVGPS